MARTQLYKALENTMLEWVTLSYYTYPILSPTLTWNKKNTLLSFVPFSPFFIRKVERTTFLWHAIFLWALKVLHMYVLSSPFSEFFSQSISNPICQKRTKFVLHIRLYMINWWAFHYTTYISHISWLENSGVKVRNTGCKLLLYRKQS